MNIKFSRVCNYVKTEACCFFKNRKANILSIIALIIVGIALGIIFSAGRDASDIKSINYIVLISKGEYNVFGTFIKVVLLMLLGHIIICCSVFHKYLCVTPYIAIFYTAYRFGVRIVTLVIADKFSGVMCLITYMVPVYIVVLCGFVMLACVMRAMVIDGGFYHRSSCCNGRIAKDICRKVLCMNCVLLPLLIIFTLLVPGVATFILVL